MRDYEMIFKKYYTAVNLFLLKITKGNLEVSEELTQETFFQVYLSLHRYRKESELLTWIFGIAKNTYYKHLRKSQKEKQVEIEPYENLIINDFSTEDLIVQNELLDKVHKGINELPKLQRSVVILRLYYGYSYKEISKKLKIKENLAKIIFHRIKIKFKEEFNNEI